MASPIQKHFLDFWLARGAIAVTAILNAFLINKLSAMPWWLAPSLEIALLIPLSIATAWTHKRIRTVSEEHHWVSIHRSRRIIRIAAICLTALITAINFEALFAVLDALLYGANFFLSFVKT